MAVTCARCSGRIVSIEGGAYAHFVVDSDTGKTVPACSRCATFGRSEVKLNDEQAEALLQSYEAIANDDERLIWLGKTSALGRTLDLEKRKLNGKRQLPSQQEIPPSLISVLVDAIKRAIAIRQLEEEDDEKMERLRNFFVGRQRRA